MAVESIVPASQPLKRRHRLRYTVAFLLLGIFIIVILWWVFRQPSHGTIVIIPAAEQSDQSDPAQRERYAGKYITFTYPSDFERRAEVETVKHPLLERVYLSRSDIEGRKIALTVQDNTGYAFEEYGSLRMRRNDSGVYHEELIERNGLNAVLFTKMQSVFEVSVFFRQGNRVVSLVVSSPTMQNGLREEVESVLDTVEWMPDVSERNKS